MKGQRISFYEKEIPRLQRRIKQIAESPDPSLLKVNKMRYELEIEARQVQIAAMKEGKDFSDFNPVTAIGRAMGFVPALSTLSGMKTLEQQRFFDVARARGLPVNACDMASIPLAMALDGEVARECFTICCNGICTPRSLERNCVGYLLDTPRYILDSPLEDNEDNLEYVTNQLGELIEYVEWKFPSHRFNEELLAEVVEADSAFRGYMQDAYQLLKRVPCPIGGKDAFRMPTPPSRHPADRNKVVAFARAFRDEVGERVDKGIGFGPEEKLRMIWAVSGPYYMDPFKVLAKWGISIPFYYHGLPRLFGAPLPNPTYGGRKLSPLEVVATTPIRYSWAGLGSRWIDELMWICRDLKIDAIINYNMLGCTATLGLGKLVSYTAERDLGIPTLQLEGRQLDVAYNTPEHIEAQLDDFARTCLIRKGFAPVRVGD